MQLVKVDYSTSDIITAIQKCDALYRDDTKSIAKTLRRKTDRQTVRAVFDYLLANVRYKLDESGIQLARRPKRTIFEKKGDCKSFSLLAGSLLYNLGYEYSYRFASYRADPTPTHVYVIAHTPSGNIIVDGVLKKFDQEKKPITNQIDKRMKGLYIGSVEDPTINGRFARHVARYARHRTSFPRPRRMGDVAINGIEAINGTDYFPIGDIGRRSRAAKKARRAVRKEKRKKFFKKVGKGITKLAKKGFALAKKHALAVPRNAFLLLVKVNFRGFATRLAQSDQGKLSAMWEKLGGKWSALKKVIDSSKNKKRILGIGGVIHTPLGGIGGIGSVTIASAIASAASIVAALSKFLPKKAKEGAEPEAQAEGESLAQNMERGTETAAQLENAASQTLRTTSGENVTPPDIEHQESNNQEYKATRKPSPLRRSDGDEETSNSMSGGGGMSNGMKIGIGVAVAAGLFLAMKKK